MNWDIFQRNVNAYHNLGAMIRIPVPPALAPAIETYLRVRFGEPTREPREHPPNRYVWNINTTLMVVERCLGGWLYITQDGSWATERETLTHFAEVWDILDNWLQRED